MILTFGLLLDAMKIGFQVHGLQQFTVEQLEGMQTMKKSSMKHLNCLFLQVRVFETLYSMRMFSQLQTEDEPQAAGKKLTETTFTCGSCDNITYIVVKPNHNPATNPECQSESETKTQSQIEIKGEAQSKTENQK
ncbi:hypothetical protein L6452_44008 [Arctium lappa]|uniref:Uncharacterized protein n=1 Tax=Arctium lappa TaxID=4217 RepID=A0ACB8XE32_ARCLA|nr:hypothetical protein L6452_44008 [Arctium lappa]